MKELALSNSSDTLWVDDLSYDLLSTYTWFLDNKHPYTKIKGQKIRLDRFLLGVTTYIPGKIQHTLGSPLDNRIDHLRILPHRGKRYLGVTVTNKYIVVQYKDNFMRYEIQGPFELRYIERNRLEKVAAHQYDSWAHENGDSHVNFLPSCYYNISKPNIKK
jgi:hypothetical protein